MIDQNNNSQNKILFYKNENKTLPQTSTIQAQEKPKSNGVINFFAGGMGGVVAATITCPLDVIKTRQQSSLKIEGNGTSCGTIKNNRNHFTQLRGRNGVSNMVQKGKVHMVHSANLSSRTELLMMNCYKHGLLKNGSSLFHFNVIMRFEGFRSLFKGLGPLLVGVVPSRSIQFFVYERAKQYYSSKFNLTNDSSQLHMYSSITAGLCCTTATSPIFVIKTKQQLHQRHNNTTLTASECFKKIWKANGLQGFYRGLTASYAGIFETMLYLTIYEKLKYSYDHSNAINNTVKERTTMDFLYLMMFSSAAKTVACCLAYPHEVVRTRLREETSKTKYTGFFQTLCAVYKREGLAALYRGLPIQVVRQVPNMAVFMGTYELILHLADKGH